MAEKKLYILDWKNGMVGIFRGSDLSQVDNGSKDSLLMSLKHLSNVYETKELIIEFLESREQLQELRESRGLERKPTFEEWLQKEYPNFPLKS